MKPVTSHHLSWKSRLPAALACLLLSTAAARAANPTLTSVNTLTGQSEDSPVTISYTTLAGLANEADADAGDTISFRVEQVLNGSLTKNGAPAVPGTVLSPGDSFVWTPPLNMNGVVNAFSVRASDGSNLSSPPAVAVPVQLAPVNDAPVFTALPVLGGQDEDNATTLSYNTINSAGNAGDVDGDAISYRVESVSSGTLTKNGTAVTPGSTLLGPGENLVWTPAANANGNLNAFTLRAWDGSAASAGSVQVTLTVAPVNDAPTITGSILATINDDAAETAGATAFLAGLTIGDVDSSNVTVVVRVPKAAEDIADLTLPDSVRSSQGNDYVYTYSTASPATQTTRLAAALFVPLINSQPPGSQQTFAISVTASDGLLDASRSSNLSVVSVDDPPEITLSMAPATVAAGVDATPFRINVSDPDAGDDVAKTITLTLTPSDSALGTLTIPSGALTGNKALLEAGMATVRYRPNAVSAATSVSFTCTVQGSVPLKSSTAALGISFTNVAPDIAGISSELIRTNDDPATPPVVLFPTVLISDSNTGQPLSATITLDNPAKGTLTLPADPLTGATAAQLTQRLRQVLFKPAANRVTVGSTETTTLTLTVSDSLANVPNSQTRVASLSVNGAPAVTLLPGTLQPVPVAGETTGKPFTAVKVEDDDAVPSVTVTLSLDDNAKGFLTNTAPFVEQPTGSGVFVFTGDPVAATNTLRAMDYTINPSYPFPAGQPGFTTFTIEARDALNNRSTLVMTAVMQNAGRNFLVTLREDNALKRPGSLRHAVENAKDNDVITFAFADYPAILRLDPALGPLLFTKHLRLKGPGADLLTISGDRDGNGTPDMQIARIESTVQMEGLTLSHGTATTGGAAYVYRSQASAAAPPGSLTLRYCSVVNCQASQWGGAIDVEEGALHVAHSLFKDNATSAGFGLGGGAVSLYTSEACSFVATTFSGNRQRASAGYGGGALYAENFNPQAIFPVAVTHCTFTGNEDAAVKGTSIHSNVFNCRVTTRGSVFADAGGRNLHVAGSGQILSAGRNLSNDAARTTLIQGGQPQSIVLLNQTGPGGDLVSTDPLLQPLTVGPGGTSFHPLSPQSPAIGTFTAQESPDQRGVLRDTLPDSGAVEFNRTARVLINEVQTDPAAGGFAFVELFVPRDSTPVDLSGMALYINGRLRHTIAAATAPVQPGFGFIIAEGAFTVSGTPVVVSTSPFWESGEDKQRSTFELRQFNGAVAARADLVNAFTNPVSPAQTFVNNSMSLSPQFRGAAYVPNSIGRTPPLGPLLSHGGSAQSPGTDTGGTPFGQDNARPFAAADAFTINEDDLITLPVLGNDIDPDGLDQLVLVDVSTTRSVPVGTPPAGDDATAPSQLLAGVSIAPSSTPLRGTALWYDPRSALNRLPAGSSSSDSFFYTIVDIGTGPVTAYAAAGGATTRITSPAHRLTTGEQIALSGAAVGAYNGSFTVTRVDADNFTIPVAFTVNPAEKGTWQTTGTRQTTARSENAVTLTVLGRNDAPTPAADSVATSEEQILRIMGDPDLIAAAPAFDTDPTYPAPRAFAGSALLVNDTDPDSDDDTFRKLRIVGVANATAVSGYAGTPGQSPVTVTLPGHGLSTGASVLISGYGGHSSYNRTHTITVVNADSFTIPVAFVEDHPQKGLAGVLTDEGRLATTSALGASVALEIRNSRTETNIIYNPRASATLNALSLNQPATDSFYYVAQDSHGAQAFAKVTVNVTGVNDTPQPQNDPAALAGLGSLVTGGTTLRDVLKAAQVLYSIPSGTAGRGTVTLRAGGQDFVIPDMPRTFEDVTLSIPATELLNNDADIDQLDTLRITLGAGQSVSREGAAVSLTAGGAALVYNPAVSARLHALAREERVIDTVAFEVFDGTASVTAIVAIEVTGRNDKPTALADTATIPEDQLLTLAAPGVLINDADPDQDTRLPDNRRLLIPAADISTTVYGARINAALQPAVGSITSLEAESGNASVTRVNAPAHGLNTGEEIRIQGTAVSAYNGQFPITRTGADTFTIPLAASTGAASAGSGTWESLRSTLTYDPRGSVFDGSPADTVFTLDGLAQGQTYTDTWTYTMTDGSMVFANDDTYRVAADSSGIVLEVAVNDVNLTGLTGPLTITAVGTPNERGTATISGNTIIYTPETSFAGDEFFTYTVSDTLGNTDSALVRVRVTVEQLNGNLQANADAFTVAKGQSPLLAVLANDDIIPATGAALSITRISTPPGAGGTAVIEGTGIRYTPAAAAPVYPYTESFAYEISGGGIARATATVTIQVANRENTLPLRPDSVSVAAGSSNNPVQVLANDNILPGSGLDLTILSTGPVTGGTASIAADAKRLFFTPAAGFLGTASFTYTATDGLGGTGTATVTVTVGGLTTNNDFFTVSSTTATPVTLDVLANDRVLGTPGVITLKAATAVTTTIGTLEATATGDTTLTFTPVAGQTGEQSFTYHIQDGTGRETAGSVTVFVSGPGLRANADFFTVQAGSADSALPVLLNDVDIPDLGLPKVIAFTGTGGDAPDNGGTVSINTAGDRILYTPAEGFTGVERFTYTVTNGETSAVAQVLVRVNSGALQANDDAYSVFKGSPAMRLEVLANDRVIPSTGQVLSITGIGIVQNAPGQEGSVSIAPDGTALLYTPNAAAVVFPYIESFTYEITDGTARRTQATVRVEVLNRSGAREMETNDDAFTVPADGLNIPLAVLANDNIRPATAAGWSISSTGLPSQGGSVQITPAGLTYTPRAGFVGTEIITYAVSDGLGGTGSATVTIKVGDISISDDFFSVLSGSSNTPLDVLANDGKLPAGFPDRSGIPGLTGFTLASSPALVPSHGGTATVSGGLILYRPASGFSGEETFTYYVKDDSGITFPGQVTVNVEPAGSDRASALLSITVTGVNDAPVFINPAATVTSDTTSLRPFANATVLDVDDQRRQRVTIRISWPFGQGTLSGGFTEIAPGIIEFSGRPSEVTSALRGLVFTPFTNRIPVGTVEVTAFQVTLNDGFVTSPVQVTGNQVTVTPVNDPPVLTGTVGGQLLYQRDTLQPFTGTNITDVDNLGAQTLVVSVQIDSATKGRLTGAFTEQPAASGRYQFTGTPAAAAAALRALVFEPTPAGRVTPTQPETSTFTITVSDNFAAAVVDSVTTVTVLHAQTDVILPLSAAGADVSQTGAEFGATVAVSGDTIVVGTPRRDVPAVDGGQVNVYERNSGTDLPWGQTSVLIPADVRAGDRFGFSVAIDDDVLVAGSPYCEVTGGPSNAGSVYVFLRDPANRDAWIQTAKLLPTSGNAGGNDNFGWSVAVDGTTVAVGAPGANLSGESSAGRVYFFERHQGGTNAFGLTHTITAADGRGGDRLGFSIALHGNTAVAGADGASRTRNDLGWELGAAYIIERSVPGAAWAEVKKLTNFADPESRPFDQFGFSVDVDANTILVGAARFDTVVAGTRRENAGAAFIYERNQGGTGNWGLTTKLASPAALAFDNYGWSVALAGDLCMIGVPRQNTVGLLNGFVDVRRRNHNGTSVWGIIDTLSPGQSTVVDRFGQSVALDAFTGAAGSIMDLADAGSARAYQFRYEAGPRLAIPLAGQFAPEGQPFQFALPAMTFGDGIYGQTLTYSATLAGGAPLPPGGWLSFNAATATFSGTPVPGNNAPYSLTVTATNPEGRSITSNVFSVTVVLDPARSLQRIYADWSATRFPAGTLADPAQESTVWGPLANPDGDTSRNLVEFLYGTSPLAGNAAPLTIMKNADATVTVTFPRNPALPLDFIHVEWGDALSGWTRSSVGYQVSPGSGGLDLITATIYPDAPRAALFVRIAVGP